MKRKSNIGKIVILIVVFLAVCTFAVLVSGVKTPFVENCKYGIRKTVYSVSEFLNIKLSDSQKEYLTAPPDLTIDEQMIESEIDSAEDIPEVEFDELSTQSDDVKSTPIALPEAQTYRYADYRGYILSVNETTVVAYDKSGKALWAIGIHMSDPILDVSGDYYMIAERGGKKIALFNGKERIYQAEADGKIKSASLSDRGDVVAVTDKEYYKGAVIVINKKGDRVFSWNSGRYHITDADIASGSRRVAISFLMTDTSADSLVEIFDISDGKKEAETTFENSIVFDIEFLGEILNVFSDNKIIGLSQKAKILWEADYSSKRLLHYRTESSGYKLVTSDNNNSSELEVLNAKGKQKAVILTGGVPDSIDIRSGRIAYNSDRTIIFSGLSGKKQKTYICSRDIKDIHIVSDNTVMVVYSSGVEFLKF